MDLEKAINIMKIKDFENYDNDKLKKQWKKISLKTHPDKGGTCKDFIELGEAYTVLENELKKTKSKPDLTLFNYLLNFIKDETTINAFSDKFIDRMSKDNLVFVKEFLDIYKNTSLFNKEILSILGNKINNKLNEINIIYVYPSIEDLFLDNIYSFTYNGKNILVPLWHDEVIYEVDSKEIIVKIIPNLPDNCEIDYDNNLNIYTKYKLSIEIFDNDHINILCENMKKSFEVKTNLLSLKKNQKVILSKEGISRINKSVVYDNTCRGDIILNIEFI